MRYDFEVSPEDEWMWNFPTVAAKGVNDENGITHCSE